MRNTLISLAAISFLLLGGCQSTAPVKTEDAAAAKPAEAAKPALTDEAKQALAKAEADVNQAKAKGALWTTAADALKKAKDAAAKGDSAATMKFAKTASEHAGLGLKQQSYPLTK